MSGTQKHDSPHLSVGGESHLDHGAGLSGLKVPSALADLFNRPISDKLLGGIIAALNPANATKSLTDLQIKTILSNESLKGVVPHLGLNQATHLLSDGSKSPDPINLESIESTKQWVARVNQQNDNGRDVNIG